MKNIVISMILLSVFLGSCKKVKIDEIMEVPQVKSVNIDTIAIDYTAFGMETSALPQGLKVGDDAPEITLITADNKKIALKDIYKNQPIVLIFYRGYWCPVCNKHLSEFAEKAKAIEAKGAKLIAISTESYENITKTKEQTGANFAIFSDSDGAIMKAFDVDFKVTKEYQALIQDKLNASISETNASKKAELPIPATFIINKNGKIIYRQFNPDYIVRASVDEIMNYLP